MPQSGGKPLILPFILPPGFKPPWGPSLLTLARDRDSDLKEARRLVQEAASLFRLHGDTARAERLEEQIKSGEPGRPVEYGEDVVTQLCRAVVYKMRDTGEVRYTTICRELAKDEPWKGLGMDEETLIYNWKKAAKSSRLKAGAILKILARGDDLHDHQGKKG